MGLLPTLALAALAPLAAVAAADAAALPWLRAAFPAFEARWLEAGLSPHAFRLAALALVGLATAVAAAWAVARPLRRDLGILRAASAAWGRDQFERRVPVTRRDELGDLAAALNGMARSLQGSRARILDALEGDQLVVDVLSHDVRNQLAAVLPRLEFISLQRPDLRRELDKAIAPLTRAVGIIENAMLLLRLQSGAGGNVAGQLEVVDLVRSAVEAMRPTAEQRMVDIRFSVQGQPSGSASPLLSRAVENLLSNAIKWSPPGGTVEVCVTPTVRGLQVDVRDHGPGIEPRARPFLFTRFQRLGSKAPGGQGLGLAIAKRIVDMHGGRILIRDSDGGGATFVVDLPRLVNAPVPINAHPPRPAVPLAGGVS